MRELALFAGHGGGILGGHLLGWTCRIAVELDAYAAGVLVARQNEGILPPFPIWDDVRTFDGRSWRGHIDVVSGGFPCTDISIAGAGAGIDGEESGLWREMARIIGEVRPRFVLVENSPALTFRGGFESLETLPPWGMIVSGELYPLPTPSGLLELRASITSVTVSGLPPRVPTPTVGGGGQTLPQGTSPTGKRPDGTKATVSLEQFVNLFLPARVPTPRASDAGRGSCPSEQARHSPNLEAIVRRVPTPVASMSKGSSPAALTRRTGRSRENDRLDHNVMQSDGGPLNPTWVEWLQGFPPGWSDFAALGCHRFRRWLDSHGKR